MAEAAEKIRVLDAELASLEAEFHDLMARLPNIPMDEIKVSMDPKENVLVKEWGSKRSFDSSPLKTTSN